MSKQPPPAPTASAISPCPTLIQISRTPRHWKFTQHHCTTRPPPRKRKERIDESNKRTIVVLYRSPELVGWLVDFGFSGPLRQYFSLYRAVSQREGERGKKGQTREKMSKQPPLAPTASAVGPCPTVIQIVGRPGTGSLPSTIAPPDHPAPLRHYCQLYGHGGHLDFKIITFLAKFCTTII